jgi:uncharacterized membrane protein YjdF
MKPDAVLTTIKAIERLRRLEEAEAACMAGARAINGMMENDLAHGIQGDQWDVAFDTFDKLLAVQGLLAPRIKQTKAIIRAGKRQAEREAQP